MGLLSSKEYKRLKNKIKNLSKEVPGWNGSILKAAGSAITIRSTMEEIDRAARSGDISAKEAKKLKTVLSSKAISMGVRGPGIG
jgi:hypothetical protein